MNEYIAMIPKDKTFVTFDEMKDNEFYIKQKTGRVCYRAGKSLIYLGDPWRPSTS